MSAEERGLISGDARVKFEAHWKGTLEDILTSEEMRKTFQTLATQLASALNEVEVAGAAPVLYDGKVGGNGSSLLPVPGTPGRKLLIVSKTGKLAGPMQVPDDFCVVENFDTETWSGDFYSINENVRPTSDAPLHYTALNLQDARTFQLSRYPQAALHGHALETTEKAARAGIPCSEEETLFSTAPDTQALVKLIREFPFPQEKIYIRKNHGFFILGETIQDTLETFRERVLPHIN